MIKNLSTKLFVSLSIAGCISAYGQCTPVSEFSENFDTLSCCAFGVVPPCWDSYFTQDGGSQIISSTAPASSPSNVYQIGYNKVSMVIMPPLTNINEGTHHFKFKARVNQGSTPGFLEFGYITDIGNVSTFVVLQPITIANGTYDNTSERIFDVPTTVPANARLAIRNPGTTWVGHYWDDAVWENKSGLGTKESELSDLKIYPNPFTDVITISDTNEILNLKITDISGRVIKTIEKPASKINLSELTSGVYFMTIYQKGGKSQTQKIIKE